MESLRAHTKTRKPLVGGSKKKLVLLDLDNEDEEEDGDGDDGGVVQKEKESLEKLEKVLGSCQKCGPEKMCKINKSGGHVTLSFQQRRGWAVALVLFYAIFILKYQLISPKIRLWALMASLSAHLPKANYLQNFMGPTIQLLLL
jgi:hypothetical protein